MPPPPPPPPPLHVAAGCPWRRGRALRADRAPCQVCPLPAFFPLLRPRGRLWTRRRGPFGLRGGTGTPGGAPLGGHGPQFNTVCRRFEGFAGRICIRPEGTRGRPSRVRLRRPERVGPPRWRPPPSRRRHAGGRARAACICEGRLWRDVVGQDPRGPRPLVTSPHASLPTELGALEPRRAMVHSRVWAGMGAARASRFGRRCCCRIRSCRGGPLGGLHLGPRWGRVVSPGRRKGLLHAVAWQAAASLRFLLAGQPAIQKVAPAAPYRASAARSHFAWPWAAAIVAVQFFVRLGARLGLSCKQQNKPIAFTSVSGCI